MNIKSMYTSKDYNNKNNKKRHKVSRKSVETSKKKKN